MNTKEALDWMCQDIAFWYMERGNTKEIIYPITKDKQKIVQNILNEKADLIIYGQNFYTIDRNIEKTIDKASYIYFLKKSSTYKKKRGKMLLPYDLNDNNVVIINKLLKYYKKNKIPFSLISTENNFNVRKRLSEFLNPFSYINVSLGKILVHSDIYTNIGDSLVILITDENECNLEKKCLKIKECLSGKNKFKIINDKEFNYECFKKYFMLT